MTIRMIPGHCRQMAGGLAVLVLLCCAGCGSGHAPATASGRVTWQGKPLDRGAIMFFPIEGTPGPGGNAKITDGVYEIPAGQLFNGNFQVAITAVRTTGRKTRDIDNPGVANDEEEQYIPEKYNTASDLLIELSPGANVKDFELN